MFKSAIWSIVIGIGSVACGVADEPTSSGVVVCTADTIDKLISATDAQEESTKGADSIHEPSDDSEQQADMEEWMPTCQCSKCCGISKDPGWPRKPCIKRPGDRNRADCPPHRYEMEDCRRSGYPHRIAPWAVCSLNQHYSACFVGGGAPSFLFGRNRCEDEGTWGMDYQGIFKPKMVWMRWTFGRKQGGEGAYATD